MAVNQYDVVMTSGEPASLRSYFTSVKMSF
ncbi:MAG: hypothetical protein PARBB_00992 [Parabacteroides distasonis]